MNRTQRIFLLFVCTLAIVLIPLSGWAQSTTQSTPAAPQQDQTDRSGINQQNPESNQDLKQNNLSQKTDQNTSQNPDVNKSDQTSTREKPSTATEPSPAVPEPTPSQNQNQNQNQNSRTLTSQSTYGSQNTTRSANADASQSTDQQSASSREGLPRTAGELPLLALIGVLSLVAAAGTRVYAWTKSR